MNLDDLIGLDVRDEAVPTPLVYVETAVLRRNIRRMAEAARTAGVGLRPHAKTHKIAEIARLQLEAGAIGLTVAKLDEARALAQAGIATSFMVAQPYVGGGRVLAQLQLAETSDVVACVDDVELARAMGAAANAARRAVDLALIVDTGLGRLGVAPAEAAGHAARIAGLEGVRFRGIRSHSGLAYGADSAESRRGTAVSDVQAMVAIEEQIRDRGIPCEIVSVGSTPGTIGLDDRSVFRGVTEWRPGNYVFFDRMQLSSGVATTTDDCALTVITSIVSAVEPGRAVVDAGKKTLTSTPDPRSPGFGLVRDRPDVALHSLSEECGWVSYDGDELRIGDRLQVIPNHACELTNLAENVAHGVEGRIDGFWQPAARGKVW